MKLPRASGVILPLFSLPSPYGVGTLGKAAYEFAEFLSKSGQHFWQMLPLGPTGFGDSPYQSFSSFAGNPYFIDLDMLIGEGLLTQSEVSAGDFGNDPGFVDYQKLYDSRLSLLRHAFRRGEERLEAEIRSFILQNGHWLPDYALFMALKEHFHGLPWHAWPDEAVRRRDEATLARYRLLLREDVDFFTFLQYCFFRQWQAFSRHCRALSLEIIGDLPIYAAMDSADVWANAALFQLDAAGLPTAVAGVPPDYFSETGQLWGNPLYRWEEMEKDGFAWWRQRIAAASRLFDVIRIDHFRGLSHYWSVPYGGATAANGVWREGPGKAFIHMLSAAFPETRFIAEDLGVITPGATALRTYAGMPGMAVLQFAFHPDFESSYLPHNLARDCVLYTGTHDNDTLAGWLAHATDAERSFALGYCGADGEGIPSLIRCGMASPAALFMTQMQDWLRLGSEGRINTPGTDSGNWRWRLTPGLLTEALGVQIRTMTQTFFRIRKPEREKASPEAFV